MTFRRDLIGKKFNKLTVIEKYNKCEKTKRSQWKCICECGNEVVVKTNELTTGNKKSCGCLKKENTKRQLKQVHEGNRKRTPYLSSAHSAWKNRYEDVTFEDFLRLSQMPCFYCGIIGSNCWNRFNRKSKRYSQESIDNGYFFYNGLDRVDNYKPHSIDNVVPCCKWCNISKNSRTIEDFKEWILRVYKNFILQQTEGNKETENK